MSEVLNRTSSKMGDSWYLPMFLLSNGSLTLMYIASLIVLARLCDSLPTIVVLTALVTSGVGMGKMGEMFLKSFSKGSCRFTNVLMISIHSVTLAPENHPAFLCDDILVLRRH